MSKSQEGRGFDRGQASGVAGSSSRPGHLLISPEARTTTGESMRKPLRARVRSRLAAVAELKDRRGREGASFCTDFGGGGGNPTDFVR